MVLQRDSNLGTEQDKVNCAFYYKIGACRHGEKCSRKHIKPKASKTIMCPNFYQNPELDENLKSQLTQDQIDLRFSHFFEDVFVECALLGAQVEDVVVCENANDHLNGNVYIKFATEQMADKVVQNLNNRWYDGRPIYAELSPVQNFSSSCCRLHFTKSCERKGMCNFMHSKKPDPQLVKTLMLSQEKYLREKRLHVGVPRK